MYLSQGRVQGKDQHLRSSSDLRACAVACTRQRTHTETCSHTCMHTHQNTPSILKEFLRIYGMCDSVNMGIHKSVCGCHVGKATHGGQKSVLDPLELGLCAGSCRSLGSKLEKQQMLLTAEPSLKLLNQCFSVPLSLPPTLPFFLSGQSKRNLTNTHSSRGPSLKDMTRAHFLQRSSRQSPHLL